MTLKKVEQLSNERRNLVAERTTLDEDDPHTERYGGAEAPLTAVECGRICGVVGQTQRQMRVWANAYPGLFSAGAFDPALFGTLASATAFSGPWLDLAEQRMANRATLWCFGLDWLVDYAARTPGEVKDIARRCLDVADGGSPPDGDELATFLADIRRELVACEGYTTLGPVWRDELRRMLAAMVRECEWKAALASNPASKPTFAEYLANADNLGFSFVFTTHWIFTGPPRHADIAAVRAASWAVQRVIRLANDLGTYGRDLSWGDLNGLMFATEAYVREQAAALASQARGLIHPLRARQQPIADYLSRQMDFCLGFYQIADFWGTL